MKHLKYILPCLLTAVLLSGCAAKKQVATTQSAKTNVVKKQTIQQRAIDAQPDFTSVVAQKAKFSINYQQRQISANGTISLIKDSIFIVSVQPLLGIELLRLEATPQEVVVVDKMNRRYVMMTYKELQTETGLPITFADIQAIAMDRMFVVGQPQSFLKNGTFETESTNGRSTLSLKNGKLQYSFLISEQTLALLATKIGMPTQKAEVSINYEGHTLHDTVLFPSKISLSMAGGPIEASGSITLPNLTFNGNVNASRINLRNYSKTSISTILTGK